MHGQLEQGVREGHEAARQVGDDIIAFSNADTNSVWVGPQLVQYSRNPQIMQNC